MTCACCGRDAAPREVVGTLPKVSVVLCEWCTNEWRRSPDSRLHAQALELGRRDVAASQVQNFMATRTR
jgi:hypothetical protein